MAHEMELTRVFPRITNATPDDKNAYGPGQVPSVFENYGEVHISVAFDADKETAERLANLWHPHAENVLIDGPAYNNPGGEFTPGLYVKCGYVITSRGCPNRCWFCRAWKIEGNKIRELKIHDGWNVLDNNLLACSRKHQESVFEMLAKQPHRPMFTGGLDSTYFTEWHAEWILKLKPQTVFFAYDTPDDWEPLVSAARIAKRLPWKGHIWRAYVLIGYPKDTIEKAEQRLKQCCGIGIMPQAMLYNKKPNDERKAWVSFQRQWAHPILVGQKMREVLI